MNRKWSWLAVALVALVVLGAGCGGGEEEAVSAERSEELAALEEMRDELQAKRQELVEARGQLAELKSGEAAETPAEPAEGEGEEAAAPPTQEELEARIAQLEDEELELAESYSGALVEFINANPPLQGEEWPEDFAQAWAMKVEEDMFLAREAVQKGGDYRRAIGIYETLLGVDPENADVQAALEKARADRYMTPERFEQVERGMTREEVADILGPVNIYNEREYEDNNVLAWFYPREDKGAAGVFFNQQDGTWKVYQHDYDANPAPDQGGDG